MDQKQFELFAESVDSEVLSLIYNLKDQFSSVEDSVLLGTCLYCLVKAIRSFAPSEKEFESLFQRTTILAKKFGTIINEELTKEDER